MGAGPGRDAVLPAQAFGIAAGIAPVHRVFPKRINHLLHRNLRAAGANRLAGRPGSATTISPQRIARDAAGREGPEGQGRDGSGAKTPGVVSAGRPKAGGNSVDVPRMSADGPPDGGGVRGSGRVAGPGRIAEVRKGRRSWAGRLARGGRVQRGVRVCQRWHDARTASEHLAPRPLSSQGRWTKRGRTAFGLATPPSASADANRVCKHLVAVSIPVPVAGGNNILWNAVAPTPR
jgi:hypothetical protein